MLAILYICSALLSVGFINAGVINVNDVDALLTKLIPGFVENDELIGYKLYDIGQSNWLNTFNNVIAQFRATTQNMINIENGLSAFANAVKAENASPIVKDLNVPTTIIDLNVNNVEGMVQHFKNIQNSPLADILENHLKSVKIDANGNLVVSAVPIAIYQTLADLSEQYKLLSDSVQGWSVGLNLLSKVVSKVTANDGLFEKFSKAVKAAAQQFYAISVDYQNILTSLRNAEQVTANGDIVLGTSFLPTINVTVQRIAEYYDFIGSILEHFLVSVTNTN